MGLTVVACRKEEDPIPNPYDNPLNDPPPSGGGPDPFDPSSIQGLHQNIFSTKCASAGCHDGNFEPDFRSVESSYIRWCITEIRKREILWDLLTGLSRAIPLTHFCMNASR